MTQIKIVRMMNGEELMGELVADNHTFFKLKNVAVVQLIPTQSGKMSVGLIPFAPYAEEKEFAFDTAHRTCTFTPNVELVNSYNRIYGSGIEIVSSV